MLSVRQSSFHASLPPIVSSPCGHAGPNAVASRTFGQVGVGCGGFQRSAPIGGAAYGIPRNTASVPSRVPRTQPPVVITASAGQVAGRGPVGCGGKGTG